MPASARHHSALRGLYVLTDDKLLSGNLLPAVEAALVGGCRLVQYRSKQRSPLKCYQEATSLVRLCHQYGALLLVNDNPALAMEAGADGVHLGQDDMSLVEARHMLGPDALIGVTCHANLSLAQAAVRDGADYVAFGRFAISDTKPDAPPAPLSVLSAACSSLPCPVVAIGGVTLDNARMFKEAGASMLAVVGGVFAGAADDLAGVTARARAFCSLFE